MVRRFNGMLFSENLDETAIIKISGESLSPVLTEINAYSLYTGYPPFVPLASINAHIGFRKGPGLILTRQGIVDKMESRVTLWGELLMR